MTEHKPPIHDSELYERRDALERSWLLDAWASNPGRFERWLDHCDNVVAETPDPDRLVLLGKSWTPPAMEQFMLEGVYALNVAAVDTYARFRLMGVPRELLIEVDGRELSREEWPELCEALKDVYGAGDGITTFNVPNIQGELSDD